MKELLRLLPYLAGAASAFVVQFLIQIYVVPLVETRTRRERWEKDVLDVGDLLSTTIKDVAGEAYSAQLGARYAATLVGNFDFNQADAHRELSDGTLAARTATHDLNDLVSSQWFWRTTRIGMYRSSDSVIEFTRLSLLFQTHIGKLAPDDWQELSDEEFDLWWSTEGDLRRELMSCIRTLASDRHALRISWRLRLVTLKRRLRRVARLGRKPITA